MSVESISGDDQVPIRGSELPLSAEEQSRLAKLYAVEPYNTREIPGQTSLAEQTRHQENYTHLLLSRLRNPVIRAQWLNLLEENQSWLLNTPERQVRLKKDPETGYAMEDEEGLPLWEEYYTKRNFIPKTREQFDQELEEALQREQEITNIDPAIPFERSHSKPTVDDDRYNPVNRVAVIGTLNEDGQSLTTQDVKDRSLTEAHEKGHVLRAIEGSGYLKERFSRGFDPSNFNPDTYARERNEGISDADMLQSAKEYLFYFLEPVEILERMSQLKNYFGMKGDEVFTKEHLDYAREHYLSDGMFDNNMQTFFDAITPDTEEAFLELINTSGI